MHSVTIISVGKNKESWLEAAWQEYVTRLKVRVKVQCLWLKDEKAFEECLVQNPQTVLLDPQGELLTSVEFHDFLYSYAPKNKGKVELAIGPDMGFSAHTRQLAREQGRLISLSKMTLTHQMCRLLLIEQIYRAVQIEIGSPYHK